VDPRLVTPAFPNLQFLAIAFHHLRILPSHIFKPTKPAHLHPFQQQGICLTTSNNHVVQRGIGAFVTGTNTEKYTEELRKRPGTPRKELVKPSIVELNEAVDAGGAARLCSAVNAQMPGQAMQ